MKTFRLNINGTHNDRPDGLQCIKGSFIVKADSALQARTDAETKIRLGDKVGVVSVGAVTQLI